MRIPEKREAANEWRRQWKKRDPTAVPTLARRACLANYGMTQEDYDAMVLRQEGRCAICQLEMVESNIDHDHATGQVRELLCGRCNRGLGCFSDDVSTMLAAIEYLRLHA